MNTIHKQADVYIPAPLESTERMQEIDIIRGFALFGVLWLNLVAQSYILVPAGTFDALPTARLDNVIGVMADVVIANKAMALFSLLFGYGFAMIMKRLESRGADAASIFLRRTTILFLIGIIHIWFVWFGDILHVYALMGFILFLTRHWTDRSLLIVGLILSIFSVSFVEMGLNLINYVEPELSIFDIGAERHYAVLQGASYQAYLGELWWASWHTMWGDPFYINYSTTALGRFMLGAWIFRQGWLQSTLNLKPEFRRAALFLLGGGALFTLIGYLINHYSGLWAYLFDPITQLTLALGYGATIVALCQRNSIRKALNGIAAVGRTALSNYLLQSLMYLLVLYGFGFGLITQLGATLCLAIAVSFFTVQIFLSSWWLKRFRFGPMEWLWRSLTYKSIAPIRREN